MTTRLGKDASAGRAGGQTPSARSRLERLGSAALWVGLWQAASMLVGSSILLAGPWDTVVRLVQLLGDVRFLSVVGFSLVRIVGGFVTAYACAVAISFVAHGWPGLGRLLAPGIAALKSVPIACIIVLLLIWVGSRQVSGIAVFLAVFPAVYYACAEGLGQVGTGVSEMLSVFRVRRSVRLCAHVWPEVLPYLVGTARNVCGMAWKAGIAAELIGSPMGSIGERIYQAKILLETADLFAWTIVVVALSAACEQAFVWLLAHSDRLSLRVALALARRTAPQAGLPGELALADASIGYGDVAVASGISCRLPAGARLVLTDASGAGKTTLLRTVAGLQAPLAGMVTSPVTASMVFQDARLVEALDAPDNVALVVGGSRGVGEVRGLLAELLPEEALGVPVAELSGGQRRRVEIVRALASPSAMVLLDEPFASLDERSHRQAAQFVLRHLGDRTLVVASHMAGDADLLSADELSLFESRDGGEGDGC